MQIQSKVLIGLGSNLDDPVENLSRSRECIGNLQDIDLIAESEIYFTEPQGFKDQPWFANQVIEISCGNRWSPLGLLRKLLDLEKEMGRERDIIWGPRIIDLDLLTFDQLVIQSSELLLPHPRIKDRAFVLVPLLEIRPKFIFPDGQVAYQALQRLSYRIEGKKIFQDD